MGSVHEELRANSMNARVTALTPREIVTRNRQDVSRTTREDAVVVVAQGGNRGR